jgi:hypothetical protein
MTTNNSLAQLQTRRIDLLESALLELLTCFSDEPDVQAIMCNPEEELDEVRRVALQRATERYDESKRLGRKGARA